MSGTNPFRRNPIQQSSNVPTTTGLAHTAWEHGQRLETRVPPIDTDLPRSTKSKTGKTVRIVSPHSATSDGEHGMQHRFFSPPPVFSSPPSDFLSSRSSGDGSPGDPFGADFSVGVGNPVDEGTLQNTLRNSGDLQSTTSHLGAMPENPFKKTLASLGPGSLSQGSDGRSMGTEPKTTRPHYDVENFKKLLLTGEKSSSGINVAVPPPVSFQSPAHVGDSSSNTDASSISRQSIFEPVSSPVQESPRTSHESALSDDERQRLVGSIPSIPIASEKTKPVTPKHRHGKLFQPNTPQTVSFEDPTLSFSDPAMSSITPVDRSMLEISTDVDKPLPPLPSLHSTQPISKDAIESTDNDIQGSYLESEEPSSSNTVKKRSPPTPPLSRRHSQLRAKGLVNNTERSTPITEEAVAESSPSSPTANSKPPPPPPRRAGLVRGTSSSSISTGASSILMSDQSIAPDVSTRSPIPRPPAPVIRSPSVSSAKRPNRTQSIIISPSMAPPPPPPPRRRGSSQGSQTPSRLSGNYAERVRSDSGASSISHLAMTQVSPNCEGKKDVKDVMADLSALQREVDELRGKFKD